MHTTRHRHHPDCFVCGRQRVCGLNVEYLLREGGGVQTTVVCDARMQGYPGLVHGGVVAALLDGAMTHCLFARGIAALTADLHVRYRHPVELDRPARVVAVVTDEYPPLFILEATIEQVDRVCARARGKFMLREPDTPAGG